MQHDPKGVVAGHAGGELNQLTGASTAMGREIVDIDGFLQDLDAACRTQLDALADMRSGSRQVALATESLRVTSRSAARDADTALEQVRASTALLAESGGSARGIAEWVASVHSDGSAVAEMLAAVARSNSQISSVASQVNILAMNAKIEAARAGDAGRGFAIVAEAINELAAQTAGAARDISQTVKRISAWMGQLNEGAEASSAAANLLLEGSTVTDRALNGIETHVADLRGATHRIEQEVSRASAAVSQLGPAVELIDGSVGTVARGVQSAHSRTERLVDMSESVLQQAVALGGTGADGAMIARVQMLAGQISDLFETALADGHLTLADLFDEAYRPVPDSDPLQVTARFTAFTDRVLPPIQEPVLAGDPGIIFCAAVDRNGYLPTHNRKFSHPQGSDPVWNTAHCRNRRIFDDRVGRKAGRNRKPFLLQVYRRDMGGGEFAMMKDLSAPITVQGRHWGGLRLAYRFGKKPPHSRDQEAAVRSAT